MTPKDKELEEKFLQFRKDDVQEMQLYVCYFFLVYSSVGVVLLVVHDVSTRNVIILVMGLLNAILHFAVYFIAKRFKQKLMTMIVILSLVQHLLVVLTLDMVNETEEGGMKWMLSRNLSSDLIISCLMLAPSYKYIWFCYIPISISTWIFCLF